MSGLKIMKVSYGAEGDRTLNRVLAKDALSQLSHSPNNVIIAPDIHEVKEFTNWLQLVCAQYPLLQHLLIPQALSAFCV